MSPGPPVLLLAGPDRVNDTARKDGLQYLLIFSARYVSISIHVEILNCMVIE